MLVVAQFALEWVMYETSINESANERDNSERNMLEIRPVIAHENRGVTEMANSQ
jgi:hypothetical protein